MERQHQMPIGLPSPLVVNPVEYNLLGSDSSWSEHGHTSPYTVPMAPLYLP